MRRYIGLFVMGLVLGCVGETPPPNNAFGPDEWGDGVPEDLPSETETDEGATDDGVPEDLPTETETEDDTDGESQPYEPVLDPGGRVHSPITSYVVDTLLGIRELGPALREGLHDRSVVTARPARSGP